MAKRRISLRQKITVALILGFFFLAASIVSVVNYLLYNSLYQSTIEQGFSIGSTLAKTSGDLILDNDVILLNQRITYLKEFESVSYVLIENDQREIISDTFNKNIPSEIRKLAWQYSDNIGIQDSLINYTDLSGNKEEVYEILCPVEEGQAGFVRIGMYKKFIDNQINKTLIFILSVIVIALIFGVIVALVLVKSITTPLIYLKEAADKISLGDMESSIHASTNDEIGDLSEAVERMRESLKAAIERLKKRQSMRI